MGEHDFEAGERAGEVEARLNTVEKTLEAVWVKLNHMQETENRNNLDIKISLARIEAGSGKCAEHARRMDDLGTRTDALEKTDRYARGVIAATVVVVSAVWAIAAEWIKSKI